MSDVKNRKLYVNEREIISNDIVNKISDNLVNVFNEKREVKKLIEEINLLGKDYDKLVNEVNNLIDKIYEKRDKVNGIDERFDFNYFYLSKLSNFKLSSIRYSDEMNLKEKVNVDLVMGGCSDNLVDYVDDLIRKYS